MAVANFRTKSFSSPSDLQKYAINSANVTSIVSVVFDAASGKYVLFYIGTA